MFQDILEKCTKFFTWLFFRRPDLILQCALSKEWQVLCTAIPPSNHSSKSKHCATYEITITFLGISPIWGASHYCLLSGMRQKGLEKTWVEHILNDLVQYLVLE